MELAEVSIEKLDSVDDDYTCQCDESRTYTKKIFPVKAKDMLVWGKYSDRPYLDLVLGYSSLNLGHDCEEIKKVVRKGLNYIAQIHSFHTPYQIKLSQTLVEALESNSSYKVFFDVGGTNATTAAFRIVRAFTGRKKIVAFEGGFHGVSYAAAAISDPAFLNKEHYGYNPFKEDVIKIPYPNEYYGIRTSDCIHLLERALAHQDKPAAVFIEPIQGANGFIIAPEEFLYAVRDLTNKYDVLMVDDEIQTGVGRTGYLYNIRQYNIMPDIVLLSKSLAGGYYPLSAVIAKAELFDSLSQKNTSFQTTFNNNPLGTYIAYHVLEYIYQNNYFHNAYEQGKILLRKLTDLQNFSWISNLRGQGLAIAFDIVSSVNSEIPDTILAKKFVEFALQNHILIYASGIRRNVIKIAVPINITSVDLQHVIDQLYSLISQFKGKEV